jgi:multiple sugar transport system ATP-binding protein
MSTLEVRQLNKVYASGDWAVRDVDLSIDEGEFFVILGPSGSGKTSVLRMVAGLEAVTSGDIVMDGERVNDVRTNERNIAMAFQNYALYPHMTVAENIGFPMRLDRIHNSTVDRRVADVARVLRIDDVLERRPSLLSGGQQQRVALGRAIVRNPRLLLMDEPMSNLDAKLRTQTRRVIAGIQRRLGLTTMYVTHDQDEAMSLGDRLAVMDNGTIVQTGRPIDVYEWPDNIFVAQFVGAPSMNVLEATVDTFDGAPMLRVGSHELRLDDRAVRRFPSLREMAGRDVAVGVRADAIHHDPHGPWRLSVMSTEHDDVHKLVHLAIDARLVTQSFGRVRVGDGVDATIVASVEPTMAVSLWQPFHVGIDIERIHLFDLSTGVLIDGIERRAIARHPEA